MDDLCKTLVIDPIMNMNSRKMRDWSHLDYNLRKVKYELTAILNEFNSGVKNDIIINKIMDLAEKNKFLFNFGISSKLLFREHLFSYISFMRSDTTLEKCNQYSRDDYNGLKVVAKSAIEKNKIIPGLWGKYVVLSKNEECILESQKIDFSVVTSGKHKKSSLFLGPAAFINHHCLPNSEYVSAENRSIKIRSLRRIESGEEVFVSYGNDYFGSNNCSCECSKCVTGENPTILLNVSST